MNDLLVLVPGEAARRMKEGGQWGQITFRVSDPDNVGAVIAVSDGSNPVMPTPLHSANHFLKLGTPEGSTAGTGLRPRCTSCGGTRATPVGRSPSRLSRRTSSVAG
ncbi:hypothetical protein GCM10010492_75930 [Saccharothrix mutabilis subsp. mutabilis]|uniref:Uncharacterized protein n=1 Tax=Saccharothrix mutabilis subsp. mutabilis TaxID=66855 RepID=A0ABN0UWJ3_9PSEU